MTSPSGSRRPIVVPRMDPAKEMLVVAVRSAPFCGARWKAWPPAAEAAAEQVGELGRDAAGRAEAAGMASAAAGEEPAEEVLEAAVRGSPAAPRGQSARRRPWPGWRHTAGAHQDPTARSTPRRCP